jgi:GxxExxY protein
MTAETPIDPDERRLALDRITEKIIGCVHQVSNVLGPGFLEKVYENALAVELGQMGLRVAQQQRIEVRYRSVLVGEFVADILVEECVIVEIKAVKSFEDIHTAQCVNYLKATGLQVCLLVNFGAPRAIVKRIVHGF